ncbi:MAG: RsfS/YbeB/iojap family protein, partial [Spirochaetales bacterium]|nr:RsfS/YbeB/iojap family protein [Spirochaetales bacterium]
MEPSSDRQTEDLVLDLAHFLDETGARDIVALDVSEQSSFARYFIIGGAVSAGQLRGLKRRAHERLGELGLRARQSPK